MSKANDQRPTTNDCRKIRMRSRASHPGPHLSCVPDLPSSPQRRRHDRFSPTTPASGCCTCRSQLPICYLAMANLQPCGGQRPVFCSEEQQGGGGRNARATSRAERVSGSFPPVTPSRESPVTASSAAFIRPSQELSRFAEHTFRQFVARCKSNS
jgi:hypothetical protein